MSLQKAKGPVPCSHLAALTAGACRCLHGLRSLFGASEVTRVFFLGILWKVVLFRANLGVKLNMTDIKVVSHTVHSERNTEENAESNQKVGLLGCCGTGFPFFMGTALSFAPAQEAGCVLPCSSPPRETLRPKTTNSGTKNNNSTILIF